MTIKFKASPSGRNDLATTPAAHAVHIEATPPVPEPADHQASSQDGAGESAVRATDSPAVQQWDHMTDDDDVDRALTSLGLGRQQAPDWNPRACVRDAALMSNFELADLLVRLSAEHDRVARLCAKQEFVIKKLRHERRDREVQVRRDSSTATMKVDDLVWSDAIYRKYFDVLTLQERVLDELKADLGALDRHHAAVSRLIEIRRQEQTRDLIDVNVSNRSVPGRWGAPR